MDRNKITPAGEEVFDEGEITLIDIAELTALLGFNPEELSSVNMEPIREPASRRLAVGLGVALFGALAVFRTKGASAQSANQVCLRWQTVGTYCLIGLGCRTVSKRWCQPGGWVYGYQWRPNCDCYGCCQ